jgi:hypothetical protein
MNYYQKYLKYKKKYLELLDGGAEARVPDPVNNQEERIKFCNSYYEPDIFKQRCIDGGSDHYVIYTHGINGTIYISINISEKEKDAHFNPVKYNIRISIIILELNKLIKSINTENNKIILNVQECSEDAYNRLRTELHYNGKQFSYTELFPCTIIIAYCPRDENGTVKFNNYWLYGRDATGNDKTAVGINGIGEKNTNIGCLCTFIYEPNKSQVTKINAIRSFMKTYIYTKLTCGINKGSYVLMTKAIFIPEYNIFNVHFDGDTTPGNAHLPLTFENFMAKCNDNFMSIFSIDHSQHNMNQSIRPVNINENTYNELGAIADQALNANNHPVNTYSQSLYGTEELFNLFNTTSAYYYINAKLNNLYNNNPPDTFNTLPKYVLGDFNRERRHIIGYTPYVTGYNTNYAFDYENNRYINKTAYTLKNVTLIYNRENRDNDRKNVGPVDRITKRALITYFPMKNGFNGELDIEDLDKNKDHLIQINKEFHR